MRLPSLARLAREEEGQYAEHEYEHTSILLLELSAHSAVRIQGKEVWS